MSFSISYASLDGLDDFGNGVFSGGFHLGLDVGVKYVRRENFGSWLKKKLGSGLWLLVSCRHLAFYCAAKASI